jgi:transcription elongation GreA/GreB family factor
MDKRFLIEQLTEKLRTSAHVARKAGQAAADEARDGATAAEKRENARVSQEYAGLARGQADRAARTLAEISTLEAFRPGPLPKGGRIALGAIVEVEEEEGPGRTFFLAPAGAGVELTGPDGDGFLSVVTPMSPIGKAVMGRRVGESIEVTVQGEPRDWTITYAA